jgi:FkbM family methyltransferase
MPSSKRSTEMSLPTLVGRASNFMRKPWSSQYRSFAFRWLRWLPAIPLPFRLSFGAWCLLRNDQISAMLLYGSYESASTRYLQRFLRPGMTMVDIGANHGYFTLLASKGVGPRGAVIAVEPSRREMRHLKQHLWLNRCKNVKTAACAVGEAKGKGELYVVVGKETGCNSLRPPDVTEPTSLAEVPIQRLDDLLKLYEVASVDLIKLDVEGAELSVLKGATELLRRSPRPVILAEVQDLRTKPWGYRAEEILLYLTSLNYKWFEPKDSGQLMSVRLGDDNYDGNFLAIPNERMDSILQ